MCGICGIGAGRRRRRSGRAPRDARGAHTPGPRQRRRVDRPPVGLARRLSIIDLEGGDQPIANEDQTRARRPNGEIYNYRELRDRLRREPLRTRATPRCSFTSTRSRGRGSSSALRRHVRVRDLGRGRRRLVLARDRFGIKPLYLSRARAAGWHSRRSSRRSCPACRGRSISTRCTLPGLHVARRRCRSSVGLASCRPGASSWPTTGRSGAGRLGLRPARRRRRARAPSASSRTSCWPGCAIRVAAISWPTCRSAFSCRVASTLDDGARAAARARRAPIRRSRSGSRTVLRRAAARARRRAVRHRPPRAGRPAVDAVRSPELAAAFDEPFADSSAIPTTSSRSSPPSRSRWRSPARGRRALRRLLDLRGGRAVPPAGRGGGMPDARRAAAEVVGPGQLRLQGQALRAGGAPSTARAPPRLEGDLVPEARAALLLPGKRSRRRSDARRRRGTEEHNPLAASGPRSGRVSRRRSAREDRPGEHGPLSRCPFRYGWSPRSRLPDSWGVRGLAKKRLSPQDGAAAPLRDGRRQEARVLHPGVARGEFSFRSRGRCFAARSFAGIGVLQPRNGLRSRRLGQEGPVTAALGAAPSGCGATATRDRTALDSGEGRWFQRVELDPCRRARRARTGHAARQPRNDLLDLEHEPVHCALDAGRCRKLGRTVSQHGTRCRARVPRPRRDDRGARGVGAFGECRLAQEQVSVLRGA